MKAFLEEYGLIIVAILVILVFVAFAAIFGGEITDKIEDMMDDLFNKTQANMLVDQFIMHG